MVPTGPYWSLLVLGCTHASPYWSLLVHTGPYHPILPHTGPYWSILVPTTPYWSLPVCTAPNRSLLPHTSPYQSLLVHAGLYCPIPVPTSPYWSLPVPTLPQAMPDADPRLDAGRWAAASFRLRGAPSSDPPPRSRGSFWRRLGGCCGCCGCCRRGKEDWDPPPGEVPGRRPPQALKPGEVLG